MAVDPNKRALMGAAGALALGSMLAFAQDKPTARVIKVVAKKFEFVPGEIHVKKGETVILQFTAPEVPMGFNLADFGIRTDIVPGKVTTLQLTPARAGSFIFACDVFCGSGHEDMSGTLFVSD